MLKRKGKRLSSANAKNDYPEIQSVLSQFLHDTSIIVENHEMFYKSCPIDFSDPNFGIGPKNIIWINPHQQPRKYRTALNRGCQEIRV